MGNESAVLVTHRLSRQVFHEGGKVAKTSPKTDCKAAEFPPTDQVEGPAEPIHHC
jgi:hypothetical protein